VCVVARTRTKELPGECLSIYDICICDDEEKKKKTEVCGRTGSRFFWGGGKIMERM